MMNEKRRSGTYLLWMAASFCLLWACVVPVPAAGHRSRYSSPLSNTSTDIVPSTDNTYDIGSSTKEWKDIYIDGVCYFDNVQIGSSVPTASSLAIQDNATSGNMASIRATPASASTATVLALEADGSNWASGANVLKLTSDDNDAYLMRGYSAADLKMYLTRAGAWYTAGKWYTDDDISLQGGGELQTSSNGNLGLSPDGNGLIYFESVTTGITAVNPGVQGDGVLTSNINVIATCANANDAVTLPSAFVGLFIIIINNGANQLEIWPASGDNAGGGVNTAVTLAAGTNVQYWAVDATNWEAM